jgi:dinuclear metal center YbgI/SA1388 family protein
MRLSTFTHRLNTLLNVADLDDVDYAVNGLQVGADNAEVTKAAFAVDGVELTAQHAADWGADVLVVHHGISWGGITRVTGKEHDRLQALLSNNLALYAVHLPLDAHPRYGNATQLAEFLELEPIDGFGKEGPTTIGVRAKADASCTVGSLRDRLSTMEHDTIQVLNFGPETIDEVGIITGSGTDWIDEARRLGLDTLITGEGKQPAYHEAREAGINVFLAGHYATETFGVRALLEVVDGWEESIETTYIDHPTGL